MFLFSTGAARAFPSFRMVDKGEFKGICFRRERHRSDHSPRLTNSRNKIPPLQKFDPTLPSQSAGLALANRRLQNRRSSSNQSLLSMSLTTQRSQLSPIRRRKSMSFAGQRNIKEIVFGSDRSRSRHRRAKRSGSGGGYHLPLAGEICSESGLQVQEVVLPVKFRRSVT